jgi:hypothetical protein
VTSYVAGDKVYCVHQADDEGAISEHGRRSGPCVGCSWLPAGKRQQLRLRVRLLVDQLCFGVAAGTQDGLG